jgi:hypothetical protein
VKATPMVRGVGGLSGRTHGGGQDGVPVLIEQLAGVRDCLAFGEEPVNLASVGRVEFAERDH